MSFTRQDADNLNRSREMFGSIGVETDQHDELITLFPITATTYPVDAVDVLREGLMSAMRFDEGMHVWIDVRQPSIPAFVAAAIEGCQGFGLRLVLTHGAACSHPPGEALPTGLLETIARASDSRQVWHPIAKRRVRSIKRAVLKRA